MRPLKCELSVFFALIFVLVASLLLASVESVRTQAARAYLTIAANSAVDSLYSQYHKELWDRYRLLGLEMYSEEEITDEMSGFLLPYLSPGKARNWYMLGAAEEPVFILSSTLLTDEDGRVLTKEIVDYMKYGIAASVPDLLSMKDMTKLFTEGSSVEEYTEGFSGCTEMCLSLEDTARALSKGISEASRKRESVSKAIDARDASRVGREGCSLRNTLSELSDLSREYGTKADTLSEKITEAKSQFQKKYRDGLLSEETYRNLISEAETYDSYVSESSTFRNAADRIPGIAETDIAVLKNTENLAEEAEEFIDDFVPEEIIIGYGPPSEEGGPPEPIYGETEIDEDEVWEPCERAFGRYRELPDVFQESAPDEKKKAQLSKVTALLKGDILPLVLPDGVTVSEEPLPLEDAPSGKYSAHAESDSSDAGLSDRIYVTEYIVKLMKNFTKGGSETEYILYGKENEKENMEELTRELMAVRTGLNFLYLFSDSEKKSEARALAAAISGAVGAAPLTEAVMLLVLTAWAMGQAVLDLKELYAGGKVPIQHTRTTFSLSLEGLLENFSEAVGKEKGSGEGIELSGYERLLLFLHMDGDVIYRTADVIQMNLRISQPDFLMERLYTQTELMVRARSSHLFTMIFGGGTVGGSYPVSVTTQYSY